MDKGSSRLDDEEDLVALRIPDDQDYLIRFVRRYLRVFFLVRVHRFLFPVTTYNNRLGIN
jgi:hypothetical protein